MKLLTTLTLLATTEAFVISNPRLHNVSSQQQLQMGFMDDLKLMFSDEGKKNRKEYDRIQKEKELEAQLEILERRRNPEKMEEYERQVMERRRATTQENALWEFQNKVQEGVDPLDEWNKLREEGKIQVGSDLERDESTSRLGSEGLVEVRVDELMPYIDQGYVDEDADVMGNFMKMFGGGKKKNDGQ